MEEREADTIVGAVGVPEEVGERVELRFDRREDVESVLGEARVLSKRDVEKVSQGISRRSRGRRNAMEKRARVGGLPDSDRSKRKRAGPIRMNMGSEKGLARGRRNMRRLEGGKPKGAKLFPKEQGPG